MAPRGCAAPRAASAAFTLCIVAAWALLETRGLALGVGADTPECGKMLRSQGGELRAGVGADAEHAARCSTAQRAMLAAHAAWLPGACLGASVALTKERARQMLLLPTVLYSAVMCISLAYHYVEGAGLLLENGQTDYRLLELGDRSLATASFPTVVAFWAHGLARAYEYECGRGVVAPEAANVLVCIAGCMVGVMASGSQSVELGCSGGFLPHWISLACAGCLGLLVLQDLAHSKRFVHIGAAWPALCILAVVQAEVADRCNAKGNSPSHWVAITMASIVAVSVALICGLECARPRSAHPGGRRGASMFLLRHLLLNDCMCYSGVLLFLAATCWGQLAGVPSGRVEYRYVHGAWHACVFGCATLQIGWMCSAESVHRSRKFERVAVPGGGL